MQTSFGYLDVPLNMEAIKTKASGGGGRTGPGQKKTNGVKSEGHRNRFAEQYECQNKQI